MSKIKLEDIQLLCAEDNWEVLSNQYINLKTLMNFKCPEGHEVYTTWAAMREKRVCPTCQRNKYKAITTDIVTKPKNTKRILALDQATHLSGWSIYDGQQLIKFGTFETTKDEEIERCHQVKVWLEGMIQSWHVDYIALEDIQFQETGGGQRMGVTVFQTLAHLQGILMDTAYENGIPFKLCSTNTWRHFCGVKGQTRTDKKRSMQILVKKWFDISIGEDESDAIGIGYYAAHNCMPNIVVENWE